MPAAWSAALEAAQSPAAGGEGGESDSGFEGYDLALVAAERLLTRWAGAGRPARGPGGAVRLRTLERRHWRAALGLGRGGRANWLGVVVA